jgi:2-polyprenyl-3-methyl-5-hydroxy-6-metoxy-1,4-benzoquinol methylase
MSLEVDPQVASPAVDTGRASKRTGDLIAIDGSYQYRAFHEGSAIQRFWHLNKQLTIARYLPPRPGELVLDVGCGSGVVSEFLAQSGATVIGIDANESAIAFARRTFTRPNLSFSLGLVDEAFRAPRAVDKIYCMEILEHVYVDQGRRVLEVINASLAPGGAVYITTPNKLSAWPAIEWLMDALDLAPKMGGDQHVARYSLASMRRLCQEAGFAIETLTTTCLFAPWLAPLGWDLARRVNTVETGSRLGASLVCVARKPRA